MKINKILIVPAEKVVNEQQPFLHYLHPYILAKYIKRSLRPCVHYIGELQFYGDIPSILGKKNTFMYGQLLPMLHSKKLPENSAYPSCHGIPYYTSIRRNNLKKILKQVEAVLISSRSGAFGDEVLAILGAGPEYKRVLRAIIDFPDQEELYYTKNRQDMYRGYVYKKQFDIYFKKELLPELNESYTYPLAPLAVRPEMYSFPNVKKDKSVFYAGRMRQIKCQADREETVAAIEELNKKTNDNLILKHVSRKDFLSTKEYWRALARSRMALSPSGRVWDSFRHCEVGLSPNTAIIAPKPYQLVAGPYLEDGKNSILYEAELQSDGKYHLKNKEEFLAKVEYYREHPNETDRLAGQWNEDVLRGHTVYARSKYILETIERNIK